LNLNLEDKEMYIRTIAGCILVFSSLSVHAGCGGTLAYIQTDKVIIDISSDDCSPDPGEYISFSVKETNGQFGKRKSVPFLSECAHTKLGFVCRPDGKTPLAGATYERARFGRSGNGCAPTDYIGDKFICVKGCNNPELSLDQQIIPEYLSGPDGDC
jgi:hypothetical protein